MLAVAVSGLLAAGVVSTPALAGESKMEKCFGVAKAGKNDCGSKASGHACSGHATKDADPNDFVALPKGTCDKLAGGSLKPKGN